MKSPAYSSIDAPEAKSGVSRLPAPPRSTVSAVDVTTALTHAAMARFIIFIYSDRGFRSSEASFRVLSLLRYYCVSVFVLSKNVSLISYTRIILPCIPAFVNAECFAARRTAVGFFLDR